MSYLRVAPPDAHTQETFQTIKDTFGFIPDFFQSQTARPDMIEAEVQLLGTTMVKPGALTRQQKEYIFLACAGANLNTYCATAHCEIIRMLGIDGPEPEQIAFDYTATDLPMRFKALLNFGLKLNSKPLVIGPDDIEDLRTFGYSEQEILEAILVVAIAQYANIVSLGLGTVPDFDSSKLNFAAAGSKVTSAN